MEPTLPLRTIVRQARHLGNDPDPGVIGVQTLLITTMIVAAAWIAYAYRNQLTLGERGAGVAVAALWFFPLTLGGNLSLYRAESLLLPIVILLSRLRIPVLVALIAACVPVGYLMAKLFFQSVLV